MERKIGIREVVMLIGLPKMERKTAGHLLMSFANGISGRTDLIDFIKEKSVEFNLPKFSDIHFNYACAEAERILSQSEKLNIKVISFLDPAYPKQLLTTADFPVTLSYKGDIGVLSEKPNIAIVGTRKASGFGLKAAERLGQYFGSLQFNVVSGLAKGCDTAGHVGALRGKGTTAAVLAHGLDMVYPPENEGLAKEILDKGGLLLSEYFVRQIPLSGCFVERDRIQAGLSQAVLIVETPLKGGTMHTAKFCREYGRRLVCLDHPDKCRNYPSAAGNQLLIKEGKAIPVYAKDEIDKLAVAISDEFVGQLEKNHRQGIRK